MDFKNVNGLERMLGMCCEGNDNELDYCYFNSEWGDEEMIDEWGEEIYKSYIELYDKISLVGMVCYESDMWGEFRFELENNEIKLIFKD
jgi:hypothetical protein